LILLADFSKRPERFTNLIIEKLGTSLNLDYYYLNSEKELA
jgi:hypothetical protein